MKRVISFFLCCLMMLSCLLSVPAFAKSDTISDITKGWYWPLDSQYTKITAPYAQDRTKWSNPQYHQGIDIGGAPEGKAIVYAARDGVVKYAGYDKSMGYYVCVYHGNLSNGLGVYTTYMHMYRNSISVSVGDKVYGGKTALGKLGNTGSSSGAHLHFHISKCDASDYKPSPAHKTKQQLNDNYINCSPSYIKYIFRGPSASPISKPSISVTSYPTTLNQGSSYGLRGSISANGAKTTVTTAVVNSKGKTVLSTSDTVSASATGNIKSMNVNNKINFSKLSAGSYTLKITAKNSAGSTTWSKTFTVKGKSSSSSTKKAPSTLAVKLTSYPTSITKGKSYGLRGSVTSNYNITSVKGYIINSKGKTVQSSTDKPNAKAMDIRYSNVNNKLLFNKLSKGKYTLKVVAYDSYGASKTWQHSFTVK